MPWHFVCDVHIPPSLAGQLRARGFDATHVIELGLGTVDDRTIWDYASKHDAIVVSKDGDFADLGRRLPGARIVLVRLGNCSNRKLLDRFFDQLPSFLAKFDSGEHVVELR